MLGTCAVQRRAALAFAAAALALASPARAEDIDLFVGAFDMTIEQLRRVVIHGFKRGFFPGSYRDKRAYVRQTIDYYDRVVAEHFGHDSAGPGPR